MVRKKKTSAAPNPDPRLRMHSNDALPLPDLPRPLAFQPCGQQGQYGLRIGVSVTERQGRRKPRQWRHNRGLVRHFQRCPSPVPTHTEPTYITLGNEKYLLMAGCLKQRLQHEPRNPERMHNNDPCSGEATTATRHKQWKPLLLHSVNANGSHTRMTRRECTETEIGNSREVHTRPQRAHTNESTGASRNDTKKQAGLHLQPRMQHAGDVERTGNAQRKELGTDAGMGMRPRWMHTRK